MQQTRCLESVQQTVGAGVGQVLGSGVASSSAPAPSSYDAVQARPFALSDHSTASPLSQLPRVPMHSRGRADLHAPAAAAAVAAAAAAAAAPPCRSLHELFATSVDEPWPPTAALSPLCAGTTHPDVSLMMDGAGAGLAGCGGGGDPAGWGGPLMSATPAAVGHGGASAQGSLLRVALPVRTAAGILELSRRCH